MDQHPLSNPSFNSTKRPNCSICKRLRKSETGLDLSQNKNNLKEVEDRLHIIIY